MTIHPSFRTDRLIIALMGLALGCSSCAKAARTPPTVSDVTFRLMTCEYLENPQGIDVAAPRLSWRESSNTKGYVQQAYRILVASSPELLAAGKGDLWDSGRKIGSQTNLIAYHGSQLKSRMRCWWKVRAWDRQGRASVWSNPATFTVGLLSPQDWRASWIGINDTQVSDSQRAVLAGAHWIWFPDAGQPSNAAPLGSRFFRVPVSIPAGRPIKRAQFVGTADNTFTLYVNGQKAGGGDYWKRVQAIDVAKLLHAGQNNLAIQAVNESDNAQPSPAGLLGALQIEYQDGGAPTIVTTNADWKSSDTETVGWSGDGYDDSAWRTAMDLGANGMGPWGMVPANGPDTDGSGETPPLPARYLRREFQSTKQVAHATAYVCGMGFFQLYVNGKAATDHVMDPALSDYRKAAYYVTTDVTKLVRNGANAVGVTLGNGRFYSPRLSVPIATEYYGTPRVLMQMEIAYTDGSRQTIVSDKTWKISDKGPIRANNEYDGETYDARMALKGWSSPSYVEAPGQWANAEIVKAPTNVLEAQMIEPMRVTEVVHPVGVTSPKPGIYIVDMGRTFYGTVRLSARARRGTTVQMTSGYEVLHDGMLKTADNRSAKSTDIYTFAGSGLEIWNPVFKGQGFRRIQVTGFPGKLTTSNFEGLIEHTDVRPVGSFSCSNTMVNKIHGAMREGMRMFLRSAPLDPDRDERQAWMGDPAKDSESDAYNFDVGAFYTKWMDDVRRSQRADGGIPDVSMYWNMGNSVEWPSVFTIIPDWYVGFYGDTRLSERNYEAMKHWVLAMKQQHGRPDGTLEGTSYGDWCDVASMDGRGPDAGSTSHDLITTAYEYNNIRIVQRTAERLGRTDDTAMLRSMGDAMQTAFMAKFFDPKTCKYTSETQCSYVLPLAFGLTPSDPALRQKVVDNLVYDIEVTHDNHLTVGLLGNQWLLQVLSQNGRPDVAWKLVSQTSRPSWGYMVNYGSNTIWERWDYDTRDPGMNSEALLIQAGNVDAWFYQTLGGINYDPAKPGFAHILIQPHMVGDLTWVKCQFDSPRGLIVSNWTRSGQNATMNVTIPANTTATVTTPDGVAHDVGAGDWVFQSRVK